MDSKNDTFSDMAANDLQERIGKGLLDSFQRWEGFRTGWLFTNSATVLLETLIRPAISLTEDQGTD
jgi:hypothetical protein